jgi:peptidyl-prolyl cis-trans isomerase SurA
MKAGTIAFAVLLVAAPLGAQAPQTPAAPQAPAPQASAKGTVIQRIIVKVNGEIFTQTDLESRQVDALKEQNKQVASPRDWENNAVLSKALDELTPSILSEAVDELLLVQRGRELGANFSEANFQDSIERIKKGNNFTDETLKQALAQSGLTMSELRQRLERQALVRYVQQNEVMRNMHLTEEETRQYYKAHPEQFQKPATVMLRELFVEVAVTSKGGQPVFNAAEADAAKEKIDAARARALKGEDFAKIVAEVSDAGSKANGGLVGPVVITELSEALTKVLTPLKPGEMTEPIRVAKGWMMFKLESRAEQSVEPFDKVKEDVMNNIYQERIQGETDKHIEKLRGQALIEWKDEGYRLMYEKAQKKGK